MSVKEIESIEQGISSSGVSVVDFYGTRCPACLSVHHLLETVSEDYEGVSLMKLNVDQNMGEANKIGVRSVPTLIFFKDGKEMRRHTGPISRDKFNQHIEDLLI